MSDAKNPFDEMMKMSQDWVEVLKDHGGSA